MLTAVASRAEGLKLSIYRLLLLLIVGTCFVLTGVYYVGKAAADIYAYLMVERRSDTWVAPYVDVALRPITFFEGHENPRFNQVVLGTVVSNRLEPCRPSWESHYDLDAAARALDLDRRLVRFRERGGTPIVSFGGGVSGELATACDNVEALSAAYLETIRRYDSIVDFNLQESVLGDPAVNRRRATALQNLQRNNEDVKIWMSLPASPSGFTAGGLDMLDALFSQGVELAGVNVMAMNFGRSKPSATSTLDAIIQSLASARADLKQLYLRKGETKSESAIWRMMGVTPMIGQSETIDETFSLEDAEDLLYFLRDKNLGRASLWTINRDIPCGVNSVTTRATNTCSGVEQERLEFSLLFTSSFPKSIRVADIDDAPGSSNRAATAPRTQVSTDPNLNPYPLWRQQKIYRESDKIVWQGRVYQTKWWTQAHQPDAPADNPWDSPWRYLGPVLVSDQTAVSAEVKLPGNRTLWSTEKVFQSQDEVLHNDMVFRARWWTQGQEPEFQPESSYDHPWQFLGTLNCVGDSCEDSGIGANLVIDYEGLRGVTIEIRENDGIADSAGRLVYSYSNQSGHRTYKVLRDSYDLAFKIASSELIMDAIDCRQGNCTSRGIAATLSIDYEGLSDISLEIRAFDGVQQMAGDIVEVRQGQSGQKTYKVLRDKYDLIFENTSSRHMVDGLDCTGGSCALSNIAATLIVDYRNLNGITMEVRGSDGLLRSSGALVQRQHDQSGRKTYDVLLGEYDLVFKKGAAELIVDMVNCKRPRCSAGVISSELLINLGQAATSVEVRVDDGEPESTGGLVEVHKEQVGFQRYGVLRGHYDVSISDGEWFMIEHGIDCSDKECQLSIARDGGEIVSPKIRKLEQELAALKEQFTDNYPDVIAVRRRIEELRKTD